MYTVFACTLLGEAYRYLEVVIVRVADPSIHPSITDAPLPLGSPLSLPSAMKRDLPASTLESMDGRLFTLEVSDVKITGNAAPAVDQPFRPGVTCQPSPKTSRFLKGISTH